MWSITVIESKLRHALPFVLDITKNSKRLMKRDGERNWRQGSCRPLEFTGMNTFRKAIGPPRILFIEAKILSLDGMEARRFGLSELVFSSL